MRMLLIGVALLGIGMTGSGRPQASPIPDKFTNLKVLPKDITRADLVPIMRSFAIGLGVRCETCHLGEGNDLSKFDFASDARPAKDTARTMMKMANRINAELKDIGPPSATPKVTCYTCHRGATKPLTAPPGTP